MKRLPWLLLLCCGLAGAETFSAPVLAVLDGDTVLVQRGHGTLKVRLADIDAPEKAQPFGNSSAASLSSLVQGKTIQISSQAMDAYGRMVARIRVGGLDVNAEQVRRGMAWEYSFHHGNRAMVALQNAAKAAPLGLWAMSNPTPPWEWRKQHPSVPATPAGNPACGKKHYCKQMTNCAEARFYLKECGLKRLDANGDGVPCETLCVGN